MTFSEDIFTTYFDSQFKDIEGLRWYPAVGVNYPKSKMKILIVGESHYGECLSSAYDSEEYVCESRKWSGQNSTRVEILEDQFLQKHYNPTYNKIVTLLSAVKYPIPETFWKEVAYYNLVQELMPHKKVHPTYEQYLSGAQVLKQIVKIIKPDIGILIGVGARDAYKREFGEIDELDCKIGSSIPFMVNVNDVPAIAIPHVSYRKFNMEKARTCLTSEFSNLVPSLDRFKDENKDSLETNGKNEIFNSVEFSRLLSSLYTSAGDIEGHEVSIARRPHIGFKVKNASFEIAFEFWKRDYNRLTAGYYFPKGIPSAVEDYFEANNWKQDGWKINRHWIYYEVYRLYNWTDGVFASIKNGSIKNPLRYIMENFLTPHIALLRSLSSS